MPKNAKRPTSYDHSHNIIQSWPGRCRSVATVAFGIEKVLSEGQHLQDSLSLVGSCFKCCACFCKALKTFCLSVMYLCQ